MRIAGFSFCSGRDHMKAKLCECGCGQPTKIDLTNCTARDIVKGQPNRFINGHQNRGRKQKAATIEARRAKLMGHPVSEETRRKISEHHKAAGIQPSPEATAKSNQNRGKREKSPSWKGGISMMANGYRCSYHPEHPRAHQNGYVYEHILVAESKLKRALYPGEVVHHLDGDKQNNDPQNITVLSSQSEHATLHAREMN